MPSLLKLLRVEFLSRTIKQILTWKLVPESEVLQVTGPKNVELGESIQGGGPQEFFLVHIESWAVLLIRSSRLNYHGMSLRTKITYLPQMELWGTWLNNIRMLGSVDYYWLLLVAFSEVYPVPLLHVHVRHVHVFGWASPSESRKEMSKGLLRSPLCSKSMTLTIR